MNNDFKEVMSQRSDEELIKILTVHKAEYNPEAVICAEMELNSRNIPPEKIKTIEIALKNKNKQQIELESKVVGSFDRLVHLIIDSILIAWLSVVLSIILGLTFLLSFSGNIWWIYLVTHFAYYVGFEYKFGKTIGKMIRKNVVLKVNGEKPSLKDTFLRTIFRFIPFDYFSYLFVKNGFHDYLSKTIVVNSNK